MTAACLPLLPWDAAVLPSTESGELLTSKSCVGTCFPLSGILRNQFHEAKGSSSQVFMRRAVCAHASEQVLLPASWG